MGDVREATEIQKKEIPVTKKGKFGTQKGGKRIQDTMYITGISREQLDMNNCANYKHTALLPIGCDKIEINHHNDKMKNGYRKKMAEWNQMTVSKRGPKPKVSCPISQKLVCLCTCMHYLNLSEGN